MKKKKKRGYKDADRRPGPRRCSTAKTTNQIKKNIPRMSGRKISKTISIIKKGWKSSDRKHPKKFRLRDAWLVRSGKPLGDRTGRAKKNRRKKSQREKRRRFGGGRGTHRNSAFTKRVACNSQEWDDEQPLPKTFAKSGTFGLRHGQCDR